MKKYFLIAITFLLVISCRKETPDNIERPGPWIRYSMNTLADTATTKINNSFTIWLLSSSGLEDYKVWVGDSLAVDWKVDGPDRDERSSDCRIDVNFTLNYPETKRVLIKATDRAKVTTTDSLLVKYMGGYPERGRISYNPDLSYGNLSVGNDNYKTIQIGLLKWTARNLAVLPASGLWRSAWDATLFGTNFDHTFGYLYNWEAAKSLNIPDYKLATKDQWQHLINEAGGNYGGGALKEKGYDHWSIPNQAATNSTGFTAVPGGENTEWNTTIISRGYYWTSTEKDQDSVWAVKLCFETATVEFVVLPKNAMATVRLVNEEHHTVQQLLDSGVKPKTIISYGYPVDSLYGRNFEGGLICYYNSWNGGGFVAAPFDQGVSIPWSITKTITNAYQTTLFTGINNTYKMLGIQGEVSAANICYYPLINGYQDWFLPSRDELMLMYTNLKLKGYGNFTGLWPDYWTSTEYSGSPYNSAESINFGTGVVNAQDKGTLNFVRAIRKYDP